jgi:hypothetical protein
MVEDVCHASSRVDYLAFYGEEILDRERERQRILSPSEHRRIESGIILTVLAVNALLFLYFPQYVIAWIICSLFMIGIYPLSMLIILLIKGIRQRTDEHYDNYIKTLKSLRLMKEKEYLIHMAWNVFFINSRSIGTALVVFCATNILAALVFYLVIRQATDLAILIAGQFMVFFVLYLLVLVLKPYNYRFEKFAGTVIIWFRRQKHIIWAILIFLGALGVLLALFLLWGYLFPGTVAIKLMTLEHVSPLRSFFELSIIIVSQFLLIRFIHSLQSRRTSYHISTSLVKFVNDEVLTVVNQIRAGDRDEQSIDCEEYRRLMTGLLEAKMYRTVKSETLGFFPLYLFQSDLSLILGKETIDILRGHMSIRD